MSKPAGHRSEHNTDRYLAPKARPGTNPQIRMKSQARQGGANKRMSPKKHR